MFPVLKTLEGYSLSNFLVVSSNRVNQDPVAPFDLKQKFDILDIHYQSFQYVIITAMIFGFK